MPNATAPGPHRSRTRARVLGLLCTLVLVAGFSTAAVQPPGGANSSHPGTQHVSGATADELAEWTRRLARLATSGALVLRESRRGPDGRLDEWFVQHHRGVPVAGGEVWRRTKNGAVTAVGWTLYEDISIATTPGLSADQAREAFARIDPKGLGPSVPPRLVVLPTPGGSYALVYGARLFADGTLSLIYLDAATGRVVQQVNEPGPPASRARSPVPLSAMRLPR